MIHEWTGTITCLSPFSHNSDETLGTDVKLRRIGIFSGGKLISVPQYSGNAYRGLLRRIVAADYLYRLDIEEISAKTFYLLFSGGALEKTTSGGKYVEIGLRRKLKTMIPFLGLFGSGIGNQLIGGKIDVGIALPICLETNEITGKTSETSLWNYISEVFYTRRDDLENQPRGAQRDDKKQDEPQQMRYNCEILVAGTKMTHSFVMRSPTAEEFSCFGAMMRMFEKKSILGGKRNVGHGRVRLDYSPGWPDPQPYWDFLKLNKETLRDYIVTLDKGFMAKGGVMEALKTHLDRFLVKTNE